MEYPTLKLVFDRKKVATKTKKGLVQIEVKSGSKRKWIGTGVKVFAGEWNKSGKVVARLDANILNDVLASQLDNISSWVNELRRNKETFDFDKLTSFLTHAEESPDFISFLKRRIEERSDIVASTKKSHRKLITALESFSKIKYYNHPLDRYKVAKQSSPG